MSMRTLNVKFKGISPLLLNNPQVVDRFNKYAKRMAVINAKKTKRTDDDYHELSDIEMEYKIYWNDELGIYVPSRWLLASIAKVSFKLTKTSKADIRGGVFIVQDKAALEYKGKKNVKTPDDVIHNELFRHKMILPQGQSRIAKTTPIFHDWSFSFDVEYDDKIIDPESMSLILNSAAKYGGFGDFRPTFGRALAEVTL